MFDGLRILSLRGEINDESTGEIIDYILRFNLEDTDLPQEERIPIELHIQSSGGSVLDGIALMDIISTSKTPVYTFCDGYVESAAFMIFLSGHRRFGYEHSTFMYHGMSMQNDYLKLSNITTQINHFKIIEKFFTDIITSKIDLSESEVSCIHKNDSDWYITIDEAITLGVVTDIIV